MNLTKLLLAVCVFGLAAGAAFAQDYESIDGAVIYDHDPSTKLGKDVFGTVISNLERDFPGRNSHGGPVCMQYPDGRIVAFNTNTSDHNLDGWSEHGESRDGGKSWKMYNRFPYSFEAYTRDPKRPAWIEAGLVTSKGTVVVFVTHFILGGSRTMSGFIRSYDQGASWTAYESVDGIHVGYPVGTAVDGDTNYVIYDSDGDSDGGRPHVLYVSTDDGRSWQKRSTLPLQDDVWYGAITLMADGGLLAGAYHSDDEYNFYYCISKDQGAPGPRRGSQGSTRRFGTRSWAKSEAGIISMGGPEATVRVRTASFSTSPPTERTGAAPSSSANKPAGGTDTAPTV